MPFLQCRLHLFLVPNFTISLGPKRIVERRMGGACDLLLSRCSPLLLRKRLPPTQTATSGQGFMEWRTVFFRCWKACSVGSDHWKGILHKVNAVNGVTIFP